MAGTKAGAQKAKQTTLKRYGANHYEVIGQRGGQNSKKGGFYANRTLAREAGRKGGRAAAAKLLIRNIKLNGG